jgi:anti-sigma regulatory factor (Ser/Thr protein kinase)
MIPTTTTTSVDTSATNLRQFTVADASALIQLLSSKLYTNKIGSFIREIGTNALDANIANHHQDSPITIAVDIEDGILTVAIGDSGLGMSPETIRSKLAVLGESTKDGDNVAHGGFGIGFLTTLAVSRNIEIDSYHAGVLYKYRICEQADQQVAIYLVSSEIQAGLGTVVKTWIDRDYAEMPDTASRDLSAAIAQFAYLLPVKPIISSDDWQTLSATKIDRDIDDFQSRRLCGDTDYTFYIESNRLTDRGQSLRRYEMDTRRNLVVMLGAVGYGVGRDMLLDRLTESARVDPVAFEAERDLRVLCQSFNTYTFSNPSIYNGLVLHFEIGELEVSSSRESIVNSVANIDKILAKVQLAASRLKPIIAEQLVHSVAMPGVFGDYITDYILAAKSWQLPTIEIDQVTLDLDANWFGTVDWFSYWHGFKNSADTRPEKDLLELQDWFAQNDTTVAQLLGTILRIGRTGRPQIVVLAGHSADKSILRLFKKAQAAHPDIDPDQAIVLDVRGYFEPKKRIVCLPWLSSFADFYWVETTPPKPKSVTFNSSNSTILIWLDLSAEDCPAYRNFDWRGRKTDEASFPRLTWTKFAAQADKSAPIYYFQADTFNYKVFKRFETALRLFKIDLPQIYLLGSEAVADLTDRGYSLNHAWHLVVPLVKAWTNDILLPLVATIGFAPGCSSSTDVDEIGRLRIAFLDNPLVRNFVDPSKLWLVDWLVEHGEINSFLLSKFTTEDATSGDPLEVFGYRHRQEVVKLLATTVARVRTSHRDYSNGDTNLFFALRYLFADLLFGLPVLTKLTGIFNSNSYSAESEAEIIAAVLAEIESGSLKRWREQNPH